MKLNIQFLIVSLVFLGMLMLVREEGKAIGRLEMMNKHLDVICDPTPPSTCNIGDSYFDKERGSTFVCKAKDVWTVSK